MCLKEPSQHVCVCGGGGLIKLRRKHIIQAQKGWGGGGMYGWMISSRPGLLPPPPEHMCC